MFNVGLGDLFVVRAAGEVTDHSVLASLEYAAEHLHVPLLVVMGHESCGAVKAASEAEHGEGPNLDYLATHIRAGFHHPANEQNELRAAILDNVEQVINDTLDGSAILRGAVDAGHLPGGGRLLRARQRQGALLGASWRADRARVAMALRFA